MTPEDKSRQYDRRRGRGVWRKHVEVPTRVVTTDATTELSEAAIRMQIALEKPAHPCPGEI